MEDRLCEFCGTKIVSGRLEALPDTTTCVDCSMVERVDANTFGIIGVDDTDDLLRSSQSTTKSDRW